MMLNRNQMGVEPGYWESDIIWVRNNVKALEKMLD